MTELPLAARSGSLVGKTIGFLSNRKANAELLLESIERQLRGRLGDFAVVKGDKGAAMPAPDGVMSVHGRGLHPRSRSRNGRCSGA